MLEREFEGLTVELRDDGVAVVTFDRPGRLNSLTAQTLRDFADAFGDLGADDSCGAIVVTGANGAFCAGMDLSGTGLSGSGKDPMQQVYEGMRHAVAATHAMRDIPQPVIAAVSGPAVGGGFAVAAAADIRICSADAMFLAPFLKLGVSVGDMGLSWLLPRLIGTGAAAEILYTGKPLGADEGHRLGFVQHVVADPLRAATELAAKIAARPRLAVQMSKELLNASLAAGGMREHMEMEMRSQVIGLMSQDHRQALKDFAARTRGPKGD